MLRHLTHRLLADIEVIHDRISSIPETLHIISHMAVRRLAASVGVVVRWVPMSQDNIVQHLGRFATSVTRKSISTVNAKAT